MWFLLNNLWQKSQVTFHSTLVFQWVQNNTYHIGNGVSLSIVVPSQWRMEEGWRPGGVMEEGDTNTTVMHK